MIEWLDTADRRSPWSELRVVVAGLGARGYSAADVLVELGAEVVVLDDSETHTDEAKLLEILGAEVRRDADGLPSCDLVVASDEWPVSSSRLREAEQRGVPVWSDAELAWRLRQPDRVVPWLGVTGTRGSQTAAAMLESMLAAAGLTACAVGMDGRPILETVLDEVSYDVLAVAMSRTDLGRTGSARFHSAAVLTVETDGGEDEDGGQYARIYHQVTHSCVYNAGEPRTEAMVEDADVVEGARAIGITAGIPAISMLGVVDEYLVDRAFIPQRKDSALELALCSDVPPGPGMLIDALAAAGLARSFGIPATAVRDGLRGFDPGRPRTDPHTDQGET